MFGEFLGVPFRSAVGKGDDVTVECVGSGDMLTIADTFFQLPDEQWLTDRSLPVLPLEQLDVEDLPWHPKVVRSTVPILFGSPVISRRDRRVDIGFDLLGSCFFLLSRYEELVISRRDDYDRFPASASVSSLGSFIDRPLVNEYLEILRACLAALWPGLKYKKRTFRILPTHDVDVPFLYAFEGPGRAMRLAGRDIVRDKAPFRAASRLVAWSRVHAGIRKADPNNHFALACHESERRGLTSEFNFISAVTNPRYEGSYRITHPWILDLIAEIASRGHYIGLHGSYESYRSANQLRKEREMLLEACALTSVTAAVDRVRQHYLRVSVPDTWEAQEAAGLCIDSSLGFADAVGFRCGTCYEYPLFSWMDRRALSLRERPLIAMDTSLTLYMQLSAAEAADELTKLKRICRTFDGDFVLLWHNDQFGDPESLAIYRAALDS